MAAHLGPCLPPRSCHPEEVWTVRGVRLGLPFLQKGLVLGPLLHLHHQHQLETASKTLHVKMSGKADSTSIRFLSCHLQSHMCQQPKHIPVNWQELKAGVDPTEEKGVPHLCRPP
ncbi:WAS/WASL interacting protein family member 1 [Phyllostomus discolor]|uniref:WAS/WASL interacting protein family member 1 n=1 Tax=Phyllostomus discolor TaxID=89673 RepID=A0A834ASW9_9CHIR|nr:WAS/WASL interacting protein family member 1 [Phyllostomus discolor]